MLQRYLSMAGLMGCLLLMPACLKEDLNKISDNYQWKPSISLPLRSIIFTVEDFIVPPSDIDPGNVSVFSKSINFRFREIYTETEYIDSLMLRMDIKNNFPAQLKVSAYYMDSSGSILKNIVANSHLTLKKPVMDESGSITQTENLLYDHSLKKADLPILEQTESILIRVLIEDLERTPQVLNKSDEWSIDISIGLRSSMNVPVDEI